MEAISLGYNRITEIANYAFLKPKDVPFYLKVLSSLGIVRRVVPVLSPKKAKRGIYEISDNYFDFWFSFVSPFQSEIESGYREPAIENFRARFNSYPGRVFERAVRELISPLLPFRVKGVGKWWRRDVEIDVVAYSDDEIAILEVKWASLTESRAKKVLRELERKGSELGDVRHFGLVAKSVEGKEELREEGFLIYDLKDLVGASSPDS